MAEETLEQIRAYTKAKEYAIKVDEEYIKSLERQQSAANLSEEALKKLSERVVAAREEVEKKKTSLENYHAKLNGLTTGYSDFNKKTQEVSNSIGTVSSVFLKAAETVSMFGKVSEGSLGTFSEVSNNLTASASSGFKFLSENIQSASGLFPGLSKHMVQYVQHVQNVSEKSEKLGQHQMSFMQMLAQQGQANSILQKGMFNVANLEKEAKTYEGLMFKVSEATGFSRDKILAFANQVRDIPNLFRASAVVGSGSALENMNSQVAISRLAVSTGTDQAKVIAHLKLNYENLNQPLEKSLRTYANITETARELGIRHSDLSGIVENTAKAFNMVGDNTDGALRAVNRYQEGLKATGLTSKQSIEITAGLIDNISKMTVGTKAFLSAQSGGPGGLQGSFQIDKLLREGKTDEVVKMVEANLKRQTGGKIVSLDDASKSQSAAAQYQRQLSLLQQSGFGGLQGEGGKRFLDSLSKGGTREAASYLSEEQSQARFGGMVGARSQAAEFQARSMNDITKGYNREMFRRSGSEAYDARDLAYKFSAADPKNKELRDSMVIAERESGIKGGMIRTSGAETVRGITTEPDKMVSLSDNIQFGKKAAGTLVSQINNLLKGVGLDSKSQEHVISAASPRDVQAAQGRNIQQQASLNLVNSSTKMGSAVSIFKSSVDAQAKLMSPSSVSSQVSQYKPGKKSESEQTVNVVGEIKGICIDCGKKQHVDVVKKTVDEVKTQQNRANTIR